MLKAPGDEGAQQMRDLIEDIIHFGNISTKWEECIIVSLYKDINGGLKLLNQVMKVLERVAENFIWQQMCIDDMHLEKTQPSYRNAWSGLLSAIRL